MTRAPSRARSAAAEAAAIHEVALNAYRGIYPSRYDAGFQSLPTFDVEFERALRSDVEILDAGSGARPVITRFRRPQDVRYVGLDISGTELKRGGDQYDETIVCDVCDLQPDLVDRFDVVVSLFLLEHVRPIDIALDNLLRYVKPGGVMICALAGGRSLPALLNRAIPASASRQLVHLLTGRTMGRSLESIFPAHYDRCTFSELKKLLAAWEDVRIEPLFNGAQYFVFSRAAIAAYLALEEWTLRHARVDTAAWYLIVAHRSSGTP